MKKKYDSGAISPIQQNSSTDELEVLWKLHANVKDERRFLADQRAKLTNCILLIATAAIALLKIGDLNPHQGTVIAIFLFVVGIIGMILTYEVSTACSESAYCEAMYHNQIMDRSKGLKIRKMSEGHPIYWRWMIVQATVAISGFFVYFFCVA